LPLLTFGDLFRAYKMPADIPGNLNGVDAKSADDFFTTLDSANSGDRWRVVFFWPKDFTFVCPTEIAAFGKLQSQFEDRDCDIIGVSTDNEFTHYAWRKAHEELQDLPFPMASDLTRNLASAAGVLNSDGVADRATFIIDPNNTVQFVMVTAGSVGRNTDEVLRVLDALQTDELCACNWKAGAGVIDASAEMTR
jgi:peroxiredoxin (alkyl hydroperoxide reductase subunit C)